MHSSKIFIFKSITFPKNHQPRLTKPDRSEHRTQRGKADGRTFETDALRTLLFKKVINYFSAVC
ncbi:hypothetical protein ASU31_06975 [Pedobacter ginsenosidimutans]|uniref:Uncharacterized protein n=1 Tax=Pedobacter ginsenosidimutans TaxID=687842 RepID=A0A0T5VUC0_9SPHI|nr:hypothetical protein ASU31_06975 [Pedobacter ginsenosidimutans]